MFSPKATVQSLGHHTYRSKRLLSCLSSLLSLSSIPFLIFHILIQSFHFISQQIGLIGTLPRKIQFGPAEMTITSKLSVDWLPQIKIADDCSWTQVEVLIDQFFD